jgi:hypothetical protein
MVEEYIMYPNIFSILNHLKSSIKENKIVQRVLAV